MELIESKTYRNLARAYSGECQARVRYEFIEYGARMQGYNALAEVIDKIVYNEFNHARMFYTKIQDASKENIKNIEFTGGYPFKEKWDLTENLRLAAEDEKAEIKLYNEFKETARNEGFPEIEKLFAQIADIENCHLMMFTELHRQMKNGTIYKRSKAIKWKCSSCGHEETLKEAWKQCPVCNAAQGFVMLHLSDEQ